MRCPLGATTRSISELSARITRLQSNKMAHFKFFKNPRGNSKGISLSIISAAIASFVSVLPFIALARMGNPHRYIHHAAAFEHSANHQI